MSDPHFNPPGTPIAPHQPQPQTPPVAQPLIPPTHPHIPPSVAPVVNAAQTLVEMQRTLAALQQTTQTAIANQTAPTPTYGQAWVAWIKKNIIWVLGILGGIFAGYQELRDSYLAQQREAEEFREDTNQHIDDMKLDMKLHKFDAKNERDKLQQDLNENFVGTMKGLEQVQKDIRIVHPRLKTKMKQEDEMLQKAKAKAILIEMGDEKPFDDVDLERIPKSSSHDNKRNAPR